MSTTRSKYGLGKTFTFCKQRVKPLREKVISTYHFHQDWRRQRANLTVAQESLLKELIQRFQKLHSMGGRCCIHWVTLKVLLQLSQYIRLLYSKSTSPLYKMDSQCSNLGWLHIESSSNVTVHNDCHRPGTLHTHINFPNKAHQMKILFGYLM